MKPDVEEWVKCQCACFLFNAIYYCFDPATTIWALRLPQNCTGSVVESHVEKTHRSPSRSVRVKQAVSVYWVEVSANPHGNAHGQQNSWA